MAEHPLVEDYARFRAAGERQGKSWRSWPERLRERDLREGDYDESVRDYHLYVQWLADGAFRLDVAEFDAATSAAFAGESGSDRRAAGRALQQAASLYSGDLLPGCYDDWILPERERLRQLPFDAVEPAAD